MRSRYLLIVARCCRSYPGTPNARRRLCFIEGAVIVEEANEAHKGALKLLPSFATAAQRLRND